MGAPAHRATRGPRPPSRDGRAWPRLRGGIRRPRAPGRRVGPRDMCGIAAIVGPHLPDEEALGQALDLLAHRGPDDRGTWRSDGVWLGSRRLAILDVTARGHQPMRLEPSLTCVFNGEIYNYLELRQELEACGHRFRTATDTEVLLHAYQEWGEDCLHRLNGMWA